MNKGQNKSGHLIDDATKTPRTQAAIRTYSDYIRSEDAVPIEFAEQLEHELAEARAEIESLARSLTIVANWKNVKRTYTADEVKEFARGILDIAALEAAEKEA